MTDYVIGTMLSLNICHEIADTIRIRYGFVELPYFGDDKTLRMPGYENDKSKWKINWMRNTHHYHVVITQWWWWVISNKIYENLGFGEDDLQLLIIRSA